MSGMSRVGRRERTLRIALGSLALFAACHPMRGCAESDFTLAQESRLPRWFSLPPGVHRDGVNVTLAYYTAPLSGPPVATVTLRRSGGETLDEVVAALRGEPQSLKPDPGSGRVSYPMYEVLTVNGITEVIEHRRMEPIFYISEDPNVRRKLGVAP
jgi:hypothetical protein